MSEPREEKNVTIEALVAEFLERQRRGDAPSLSWYTEQYPDLADDILELFPTIEAMEQLKVREEKKSDAPLFHELPRKKRIGSFQIIREIGRGGMGVIYLVLDPKKNKRFAIKTLRIDMQAGEEVSKRFFREVNLVKGLIHPNIVRVYQVGIDKDSYYMVMDFIEGYNLGDFIERKSYSIKLSLEIIAQIARALDYAHGRGIIHRDIKPGNILLDRKNTPYLMDFGMAHSFDEPELTKTGQILGTPFYMSPEQARGMTKQIDARSDIYSLGAVMYEILSGKPVVEGNGVMQVLHNVVKQKPLSISKIVPSLSKKLDYICMKAIEKEPDKRYQSMTEFASDIEEYLEKEPSDALVSDIRIEERQEKNPPIEIKCNVPEIFPINDMIGDAPTRCQLPISLQNLQTQGKRIIPGYEILEKIGQGGMGVVYLARQISLNRTVAIKVMELARRITPEDRARFVKEARAMAQLNHTNIIQAHDLVTIGEADCLVMEYVEGIAMNKFVKNAGFLSEDRAVSLVMQAIEGISRIWKHGLVHCDIKPGNLILSKDNVVKVGDMGLVRKEKGTEEKKCNANPPIGTPHYMSPEQIRGANVDYRSDVYSLGATLYYLVSGHHPYEGMDSIQVVRNVLGGHRPLSLSVLTQGRVSCVLENLINRWMSRDPSDRCQNMEAVSAMMKKVAEEIENKRPMRLFHVSVPLSMMIASIIVILAGSFVYSVIFPRKAPQRSNKLITQDSRPVIPHDTENIVKIPEDKAQPSKEIEKERFSISKMPEENLEQVKEKLHAYEKILPQCKESPLLENTSAECSRLEKVAKEKSADKEFLDINERVVTLDIVNQWNEWERFIKDHPGTGSTRIAISKKEEVLNTLCNELGKAINNARDMIKDGQYSQIRKLHVFQEWLSQPLSSLQKRLLDVDPRIQNMIQTLETLVTEAERGIETQRLADIDKIEKEFFEYRETLSLDMEKRDYQTVQHKLENMKKRLEDTGNQARESNGYKEIEEILEDVKNIGQIFDKVKEGISKKVGETSFLYRKHGEPLFGQIRGVHGDKLAISIKEAQVEINIDQLHASTISQIALIADDTPRMKENIAILFFWDGDLEMAHRLLDKLVRDGCSKRCKQIYETIKKIQETKLQEVLKRVEPKIKEAFKSGNPDRILELIRQIKDEIQERKTLLIISKNLQKTRHFWGELGEQAILSKCPECEMDAKNPGPGFKNQAKNEHPDNDKKALRHHLRQSEDGPPPYPPIDKGGRRNNCPKCSRRRSPENRVLVKFFQELDEKAKTMDISFNLEIKF